MSTGVHRVPSFSFAVDDVFFLERGATVFVGRLTDDASVKVLTPCDVEMVIEDEWAGTLHLIGERSRRGSSVLRMVETVDEVVVSSVRGRRCLLGHRE